MFNQRIITMKKLSLILSFSALTLGLFAVMSCNSSNNQGQQNATDQPAETPQTTLFKAVATENDVFPANCDTMGIAWGDLNQDGLKDVVVVATPRLPEKMQTRDDGYEYNFNSPVMGIYFGTTDGKLALYKEYENTIPGTEDEFCFIELETEISDKGVLSFNIEYFYSAGSTNTNYNKFLYRYQDNDFYLIGADTGALSRYSGENEVVSFNYLTHKKQTIVSDVFNESVEPKETWETIPEKPLEKLGARLLDEI